MNKKILAAFFFTLFSIAAKAQLTQQSLGGSATTLNTVQGGFWPKLYSVLPKKDTLNNAAVRYVGAQTIRPQDTLTSDTPPIYVSNGHWWYRLGGSSGGIIPAGPITTIPTVGFNPGTNLGSDSFIIKTFYGAQPPLATLTGGGIFEFTSASTVSATLNWSASRQSATAPISTIVVAGTSQSFSQPSTPGTVSGTQGVTVTTNTGTTYNNVVTTTDAQTVTASTTFTYRSKYYIGYVATSTPTDANIIAALGGTVGGTFATTQVTSGVLPAPATESYIVFAYPSTFGTATIKIQGLTVGYYLTTRSLVNASGYSTSYNIYISPYSTNGGVEYQVL